jgi:predicted transglutaminase-like cysteine proteinase
MRKLLSSSFALLFFTCMTSEVCAASNNDQKNEPFGLAKFAAPESSTAWRQWTKTIVDAAAEIRKLERCRTEPDNCNAAEWRFAAIVNEARRKDGRAKIEFVNRRINGEISYRADKAQWRVPDAWSLPVDTSDQGSLNTGVGDCEDYVLAKYAVLHQAGFPDDDLRIVLVHDNAIRDDHAVLAIRYEKQWLILDNRWNNLSRDEELKQFKPLMTVERNGINLLSKMFRIRDAIAPNSDAMPPDTLSFQDRWVIDAEMWLISTSGP